MPTRRPLALSASGTTWSAFDPTTPQAATVTVKRYNIRFTEYLTRNRSALDRLSDFEGRRVPGLPKLVRAGLAAGQLTLLSEGLIGEPLDQACADHRGGVDATVVILVIGQLARALNAMHLGGLLHVDVRPAAIMVDLKTQRAQFADWGHAVPVEGLESQLGGIPGIAMDGVPYASAELLAGMSPQPSDDVFALACVAYEMFSGRHPFGRRSAADAIALGLAPDPLANIDPAMHEALMKALALRRETRRISMRDLAEVFNRRPRAYGMPALDALLRSAWHGSFARGAAVGIAFGAAIAAAVMLLVGPDQVVRGPSPIAPSMVAGLPSAGPGLSLPQEEPRRSAAATAIVQDDRVDQSVRSATGPAPTSSSQVKAGGTTLPSVKSDPPAESVKSPAPSRPAPDEIKLTEDKRLARLVLGEPGPGNPAGGDPPSAAPTSDPLSSPAKSDGAAPSTAKPGDRGPIVSAGRALVVQALVACPQCSCVGLREKRFSEGKSLSWEEANFVLNVCGG